MMEKAKNLALVGLWALLAFRVYTLISDYKYDTSDLVLLALFAWLGGMVTTKVLEQAYELAVDLYHKRNSSGRVKTS